MPMVQTEPKKAYVIAQEPGEGTLETIYIDHLGRRWSNWRYNDTASSSTAGPETGYLRNGVIEY